jgi:hypothetical protein
VTVAGAPIALWAVPRSRSTAFLRIMLERGDLEVVHEPFSYFVGDGSFELGGRRVNTMPELLNGMIELNDAGKRVFFKDTSDYRYPELLAHERLYHEVINTFIIRDPAATVASHYAMNPNLTLDEAGFEYLHTIFEAVRQATGEIPLVIDGDELVADPAGYVRAYCEHTGLPFLDNALSWQPGTKAAWQRTERWHQEVANSTGLTAKPSSHKETAENNPYLRQLVEHHRPFYEAMHEHRLVLRPQTAP